MRPSPVSVAPCKPRPPRVVGRCAAWAEARARPGASGCTELAKEGRMGAAGGTRLGRLDWEDLRVLVAVAEEGSLAAAARALGVNHTTVLRRVNALEARAGGAPLERPPPRLESGRGPGGGRGEISGGGRILKKNKKCLTS